jgi:nuclear pore complex protein Nup54
MVHPGQIHLYTKPPQEDDILWNQAQLDNPDSSCMVPVAAVGFEDLEKRFKYQHIQSEAHQSKLKVIFSFIVWN